MIYCTTELKGKHGTEDCAAAAVVSATNAAYSPTDLPCDYSYATSSANSVNTHVNEAYTKLKKEEDSADCSL